MDKKERNKAGAEIDIIPLLKALLSRLWLMVLVGSIVAGVVYGATKILIKPTYRCGFTAYVNNQHAQAEKSVLTNSDLVAAQQLTKTYNYIICSNTVLMASLKSIDSDLSYNSIRSMVSTSIQDQTELISVYVINHDPELAYELANAIAKTAPTYVADIVEGSSMKIVDYPTYSENRYGPNYLKYAILGFLFGFMLIAIIVIIRFFKDDSVKEESELELRFSLPVLGVIPDINATSKSNSSYYSNNYGYANANTDKTQKG